MRFVDVKVVGGVFTLELEQDMVTRLTETMVAIESENMRPGPGWWSRRSRAATGASAAGR